MTTEWTIFKPSNSMDLMSPFQKIFMPCKAMFLLWWGLPAMINGKCCIKKYFQQTINVYIFDVIIISYAAFNMTMLKDNIVRWTQMLLKWSIRIGRALQNKVWRIDIHILWWHKGVEQSKYRTLSTYKNKNQGKLNQSGWNKSKKKEHPFGDNWREAEKQRYNKSLVL